MKNRLPLTFIALTVCLTCGSWAKDDKASPSPAKAAAECAGAADIAAIRATEGTFKKAFDGGDAKAVAAHWSKEGEFVDENGRRLEGRDAIEKEYKAFFAANPGARITSHIDSLRLVGADVAIEDGTASVENVSAGAPSGSRYTVVHAKRDGKWLMCSVRETLVETPSNYPHLADLNWLIGTWVTENQGVELQMTCSWTANKNFIEQKFESRKGKEVLSSGTQFIGWDPVDQDIASRVFSSEGGNALGIWTPNGSGWIVKSSGTMHDGTPTSAVNILTRLDDNGFSWRSVNRTAGAFRVLDTNEVILKRKQAAAK